MTCCDAVELHQSSARRQQVGTRQHGPAAARQSRAGRLPHTGMMFFPGSDARVKIALAVSSNQTSPPLHSFKY